jgi:hypothetical protein
MVLTTVYYTKGYWVSGLVDHHPVLSVLFGMTDKEQTAESQES